MDKRMSFIKLHIQSASVIEIGWDNNTCTEMTHLGCVKEAKNNQNLFLLWTGEKNRLSSLTPFHFKRFLEFPACPVGHWDHH